MEANNSSLGHKVQHREQFTVTAVHLHSCVNESHYLYSYTSAAGGVVKK